MPRKQKKYHFIYKTTNLINQNYYIGMHSTNDLNDGYIGSGKRLWYSIKKYGKENFNFEILEFLPNRKKLKNREKEIVNEGLLKDSLCMNLKPGGEGGFCNEEHRLKFIESGKKTTFKFLNQDENFSKKRNLASSLRGKEKFKLGLFKPYNWSGKTHSEKTKKLLSDIKKGTGIGNKNSQFETLWITNGVENKKIKKNNIIPDGWFKGRVLKK